MHSLKKLDNFNEYMNLIHTYGDKTAVSEKKNGVINNYTYEALHDDVIRLSCALKKMNFGKLRTVIIGENSYYWLVCYLAVVCSGGVVIPFDIDISDDEFVRNATRINAELVFYSDEFCDSVLNWQVDVPTIQNAFCFDSLIYEQNEVVGFINSVQELPYKDTIEVNPDGVATIIFSSGTTGANKGVMLTQKNILHNQYICNANMGMRAGCSLLILPMHHLFGLCVDSLGTLYFGDTLCIGEGIHTIYDDIKQFKPSRMCMVPSILNDFNKRLSILASEMGFIDKCNQEFVVSHIYEQYGEREYKQFLAKVKEIFGVEKMQLFVGGAPCNYNTLINLTDTCFEITCGYGMTETAGFICKNSNVREYPNAVGKIFEGVQSKIVDPDINGVGELFLKSECIINEYYNDLEATQLSFTNDGWIKTGDFAMIDDDGNLTITGRKKNTIIFDNGENICPEEIEKMIYDKLSYIEEAVVTPIDILVNNYKKSVLGVLLYSSYLNVNDGQITDDLRKVNHFFAPNKRVQCYCIVPTAFEKTRTKKIKRDSISNLVDSIIEENIYRI